VGVTGASKAIDAAVFAASVGIDGPIKGNVRAIVAGLNAAAGVRKHSRRRSLFQILGIEPPAVVSTCACVGFEAAAGVAHRPSSLDRSIGDLLVHGQKNNS